MSQEEKRPQYFSNGDFEKVAKDIINSPRRALASADTLDESLFKISEKQQEYYTKCFRHLLKATQGVQDLNGALHGADQRVVAFFKRSALDVCSLSKIWSLADVSEDGWLDLAEFSTAMHLVVLRVKGEVPIPDALPISARPPIKSPRGSNPTQQGLCSGAPSFSNSVKMAPSPSWVPESTTMSDGRIPAQPVIKQFSDTPPLLVDSRPTAIKHSALLALKSPSGPPPVPPPRPQQRGHGRSASLDLKLIALNNGGRLPSIGAPALAPPSTLALSSTTANPQPMPGPPSIIGSATSTQHLLTATNSMSSSSPRSPQPTSVSTTTTNFASFPETPDSFPQAVQPAQPPPIPQRISPPQSHVHPPSSSFSGTIPRRPVSVANVEAQTDGKLYTEEDVKKFIDGFGSKMEDLLGDEAETSEGRGPERWSKRCAALRQQNTELEAERARLAQVRIQLEIRLQEFEERAKRNQHN